jgi:hypothetical protein
MTVESKITGRAALGLAFLAIALLLFQLISSHSRQSKNADALAELAGKIATLELQQRSLQAAYLTGDPRLRHALAGSLGYQPVQPASLEEITPEAERQQALNAHATREKDFANERVDPTWAAAATRTVEDALVNIASGQGAPALEDVQLDCRSRSCRIVVNMADSFEAGMLTDPLVADISAILPNAQMIEVPSPDGQRIDLYIYAYTSR